MELGNEVGHHVQKLTGTFKRLEQAQGRPKAEFNRISVRMELQADCYAGVPESFTHGTSAQRVRWFKRGLDSGRPQDCDTFSAASL